MSIPITAPAVPEPWDYQPGLDTAESWRAFGVYLAHPPPRRLSDIARALGASYGAVARWAREHLWRERGAEWDRHCAEIYHAATLAELHRSGEDIAAEQAAVLRKAHELLGTEITKYLAQSVQTPANVLRPNELTRLLKESIMLNRLIRGQSTENVQHAIDLSKLSDQELDAYETLTKKAQKQEE